MKLIYHKILIKNYVEGNDVKFLKYKVWKYLKFGYIIY